MSRPRPAASARTPGRRRRGNHTVAPLGHVPRERARPRRSSPGPRTPGGSPSAARTRTWAPGRAWRVARGPAVRPAPRAHRAEQAPGSPDRGPSRPRCGPRPWPRRPRRRPRRRSRWTPAVQGGGDEQGRAVIGLGGVCGRRDRRVPHAHSPPVQQPPDEGCGRAGQPAVRGVADLGGDQHLPGATTVPGDSRVHSLGSWTGIPLLSPRGGLLRAGPARIRWPATMTGRREGVRPAVASAVVPVSSRISLVMVKPDRVHLVTRRVGHGSPAEERYRLLTRSNLNTIQYRSGGLGLEPGLAQDAGICPFSTVGTGDHRR